jgi:hypothetical protein
VPLGGAALFSLFIATSTTGLDRVGPFEITADVLRADLDLGIYVAEGEVIVRRGSLVLSADRVVFEEKLDLAVAEGDVILVEGTSILSCDRVSIRLPNLYGEIANARISVKRGVERSALLEHPKDAPRLGETAVFLGASRLSRTKDRELHLEDASFTPCRCGEDETPSWRVEAASASVDLDEGAWLVAPVFYAKDLPVFILPAIYLPLGERRSGLLLPKIERSAPKGISVVEPLYLTLGRSWDATIEAGYMSARGLAPGLELRWSPDEHSSGEVHGTVLLDRGVLEDGSWIKERSEILPRFAIGGDHVTRGDDWRLGVEINLASDPAYLAEFRDRFIGRQAEESVSRATYSSDHARSVRVAAGVSLREDLRPHRYAGSALELREISFFDPDESGLLRQRFAELRLDAPLQPISKNAPFLLGEARLTVHGYAAPSAEQLRFARVDLRPAIAAAIPIFGLSLSPEAALRLTAWSGSAGQGASSLGRTAVVLRSSLSTELSRRFGDLEHRIRPSLLHTIIPLVEGSGPGVYETRDEIDRLARVHQIAFDLRTDLWSSASGERIAGLGARLGRDLGLSSSKGIGTSELVLDADLELPLAARSRVSTRAVIDTSDPALLELVAALDLEVRAWLSLGASWGDFADRPARESFVGSEELVPSSAIEPSGYVIGRSPGPEELPWSAFRGITARVVLRPIAPLFLRGGIGFDLEGPSDDPLRFAEGGIGWSSPCGCWSAALDVAAARDRSSLDIRPDLRLLLSFDETALP